MSRSLAGLTDDVLAIAERAERVKLAEVEAVRAATPRFQTELGQLLHKAAEDLRATPGDVTIDDLQAFVEGRL